MDDRSRETAGGRCGEALFRAAALLRQAGFRTPRLDAEVLLGHVTGFSRELLLAHPERTLTPEQTLAFDGLVTRRLDRCPVAYLVGHKEFMSLDFLVGPGVLIPRPETELLVEVAVELARGAADAKPGRGLVLADVGTGSGAVAVALARLLPDAAIYATDTSEAALEIARRNAARLAGRAAGSSGPSPRILFRRGDLFDALAGGAVTPGGPAGGHPCPALDGVVANLPYVPDADWERLEPNVRDFEPPESLRGGPDGLDLIRRLAAQLPAYLAPGGFICLEVGAGQAADVGAILQATGLFGPEAPSPGARPRLFVHRDLAGVERVVSATNAAPAGQPRR